MTIRTAPPTLAAWTGEFDSLALACTSATAGGEAQALRLAYRLLAVPPSGWAPRVPPAPDAFAFETLLGCGAMLDAAMLLIEGWAGYMLSNGGGDRYFASVAVARDDTAPQEFSADGPSAALALVGALAAAFGSTALFGQAESRRSPLHRVPGTRLN